MQLLADIYTAVPLIREIIMWSCLPQTTEYND